MTKEQIIKEAKIEANNDEKHSHIKLGYQDGIYYGFLEGANYVMKQLILSGVIKSVCLENNTPIECNQFLALGNCEKCNHFNKQTVL